MSLFTQGSASWWAHCSKFKLVKFFSTIHIGITERSDHVSMNNLSYVFG